MPTLKGNADKIFKLLLSKVSGNVTNLRKEYTISEIGSIIPKQESGIQKYESYNYAMTSMFI